MAGSGQLGVWSLSIPRQAMPLAQQLYDAAIRAGATPTNALYLVGSAYQESGFNLRTVGDGGSSVGLMQVDPALMRQWRSQGVDVNDPVAQMEAYIEQLQRMSPDTWSAMQQASNPLGVYMAQHTDPDFRMGIPGSRFNYANQLAETLNINTTGPGSDAIWEAGLAAPNVGFDTSIDWLRNPAPPESPFFGAETYRGPDPTNPGFDEQFMLPTGGDDYRGPGPGDTPNTFGGGLSNPGFDEQYQLSTGGDAYRTGVTDPGYSNPAPYENWFAAPVEQYRTGVTDPGYSNLAPFDDVMPTPSEFYQLPEPFNPPFDDQFTLPTPTEPYQLEENPGFDEQFVLPNETFPWQLPDVVESGPSAVLIDPFAWNITGSAPNGEPIYGSTALDPNIVGFDPVTGEPIYGNVPEPINSGPSWGIPTNPLGGLAPSDYGGYTNPDGTPFNPAHLTGPGGGIVVGSSHFGAGLSGVGGWLRTSMFRPGDSSRDFLMGRGG